ncbi:MAG: PKD domain-containing protein, partial [Flavobacteriales bacterium]|nr:PKD domain-containing protein [Flavobacteriales bacterium]
SIGSINHSWSVNANAPVTGLQPVFTADAVGSYAVALTAANSYGCEDTAEGEFTVHLAPTANLTANPRIGCNPLSVDFQDLSSYSQATSLYIEDIYEGPLPTEGLIIDQVGTFESYIVATSPEGCTDTLALAEDFTVHPVPLADFSFIPLTASPENTSFQFSNESNTAFATNWTFGDGNGSFIPDPLHRYDEPGEYQVVLSVQNEFGCSDIEVDLLVIDDKVSVFVPNAFTPASNGYGDGINDGFKPVIRGVNLIQRYKFQVFDRWGTVVFETEDYEEYWKGDVDRGRYDEFDYFAQNEVYNWKVTLTLSGEEPDEIEATNPFCTGPRQFCGHVSVVR